ncbi:formate dehydrogenase, partial [bacterium]|nr:formate dehydrogenase [bacterium]
WLRQIMGQNFLYMNPLGAEKAGVKDMDWVWVESPTGKIRVQVKLSNAVQHDTVWTWNGMGKIPGAWNLAEDVDEAKKSFLLNHLITEEIAHGHGQKISNSDPISGQAAWFDLRVSITKATEEGNWPVFKPIKPPKHMDKRPDILRYEFMRDKKK